MQDALAREVVTQIIVTTIDVDNNNNNNNDSAGATSYLDGNESEAKAGVKTEPHPMLLDTALNAGMMLMDEDGDGCNKIKEDTIIVTTINVANNDSDAGATSYLIGDKSKCC